MNNENESNIKNPNKHLEFYIYRIGIFSIYLAGGLLLLLLMIVLFGCGKFI